MKLLIGNTNLLIVHHVRDEKTGLPLNAADITATLKKLDGTVASGIAWPVDLVYITGTKGEYQAELDASLDIELNTPYILDITISAGGQIATMSQWVSAHKRSI